MSNYKLDAQLARQSDGPAYISRTGKYVGVFTKAEDTKSKKGTMGVDFSFESNSKEKANYLTIWTFNANGEKLKGLNVLNAIMTCLRVKEMNATPCSVKEGQEERQAHCFFELQGKPIGLLLAKEPYRKNDGTEGVRMVIEGVFDAETELTASEILERKTTPARLAEMVLRLKDRPHQDGGLVSASPAQRMQQQTAQGVAGLDDDVPF